MKWVVAERNSYFCLARKLIWPLGSTHIFPQWGWLIHEESHLIQGPLESISLDRGFPVEYELDEFIQPHIGTPLSRLQLWLCRLQRKILHRHPATTSLGNIFWRHSRFSPQTTRTTHPRVTTSFLSLTSKHNLC